MACFDLADLVCQGVQLYESINSLDHDWRLLVLRDELPYDAALEKRIETLYRDWLTTSQSILQSYEAIGKECADRGFDKDQIDSLKKAVREIVGALTPDAEFFSHSAIVNLRDEAIDSFRAGDFEPMT